MYFYSQQVSAQNHCCSSLQLSLFEAVSLFDNTHKFYSDFVLILSSDLIEK